MSDDKSPVSKGELKRRRLLREHQHDRRCRTCFRPTTVFYSDGRQLPDDAAVLARIYPRDDPRNERPGQMIRKVLMCCACATGRSAAAEKARPIEELWLRSGRAATESYFVPEDGSQTSLAGFREGAADQTKPSDPQGGG